MCKAAEAVVAMQCMLHADAVLYLILVDGQCFHVLHDPPFGQLGQNRHLMKTT